MTAKGHKGHTPTRAPEADAQQRFLGALALGASVTSAAKAAGVDRRTVYKWREKDESFKQEWIDHVDMGADVLEDEATRRAVDGVKRPVYQGGRRVGFVREHSDQLLMFLLKGRRPEKYRERQSLEHSGPDGTPIQQPVITLTVLPPPSEEKS